MTASTNLLIAVALILFAAQIAGHLSLQIGMPRVLGKLIVGLILGPALLRIVSLNQSLDDMANIGVILLMFVAGLETDVAELRKVGRPALLAACGGVLLPLGAGTGVAILFGVKPFAALFVGTVLTATSVSITAQTLQELGQLQTRIGSAILGAAVIDDVLGIVVLALVTAFGGHGDAVIPIVKLVLFIPLAIVLGGYAVPLLVERVNALHSEDARIGVIIATVLAYSWAAAQLGGLAAITGAYIAGVLLGRTELRTRAAELVSFLGYTFFIPVFFVSVGMALTFADLRAAPLFTAAIIAVAIVTKILGCFAGAVAGGFNLRESTVVGLGMVSRGEVALVVATIGLQSGVIAGKEFSVAVVMTVVTTIITPVFLKLAYAREQPTEQELIVGVDGHHSGIGLLEPPLEV